MSRVQLTDLFLLKVNVCHNYKTLNEADRAQGYVLQDSVRCDRYNLTPGWYRFQGDAGDQMPDNCVPIYRCGANAPGWISGAHPTVAEGLVYRKVCYNKWGDCCYYYNNILVKNCGAYYVYKLERPPTCSLRYCGNGKFS